MSLAEILITGGSGQLGLELARLPWPDGLRLRTPDRSELDLSSTESITAYIDACRPLAIINAGGYTQVDGAESDPLTAFCLNAMGPAAIAEAARRHGSRLIHISTDYVFDGSRHGFYDESDAVSPLGVYGASKEAGEQAVRAILPGSVIVRTAWLFSPYRTNFVKTMLRIGRERPSVRIVADQFGCPTAASDLARALQTIAMRLVEDPAAPTGTFHFVNGGEATWYALACEAFAQATRYGYTAPAVAPISTAEYPTPARRPANSRLSVARLTESYAITPRPWKLAVAETVEHCLEGESTS
ncbi:dTDP-4-dehydrorhamnose reductase [Rhodomicrobium vannielii ATCC 17100]|uniref:dTDP-4-dehydrorhamnose reductase n=1 Tax=Rhodomicrobium vannielii (strain ATCC 17100 / DSM 162 / LMG 4299 / NCIMB 10020 / ATH 3.1.1) TaxID=648757 RepID=E3I0X0_RHOVT|nr:dTDP-4-dehydrorhamnose reductase [Rhodomicrobium vannielii]ADP72293.1 dTDP-4-dehydrorhamnose reductase [Rhodomicrobium vannielii ATCC 17100]